MPLDVGVGIFGAMLFSRIMAIPLTLPIVFAGIIFVLLPDVDFAIYFWRTKKIDELAHEHRDILHKPIPYIVVGFLLAAIWSVPVALFFAALAILHFLHDSISEQSGWGIAWLYPFSKKYYKFFSGTDGKWSRRFIVSWTLSEQREAAKKFGDRHWVKTYIFSPDFFIELLVFIAAMSLLLKLL